MAFFERAKQTLTEAGKELGQKANDFSTTAKFTIKIKEAEKRLNDAYALLGRQIMEENEEAAKNLAPDMVLYIKQKMDEIIDLKEQMEEVKKAGKCPSCGKTLGAGAIFCEYCGVRVVEEEQISLAETFPEEEIEVVSENDLEEEAFSEEVLPKEEELVADEEEIVEEMQMKTCPGCGNKIQLDDKFCFYCGMKL